MEKFIELAYLEAKKAFSENEVPIGCVIVKNGVVLAATHNMKEQSNDATNHAEILAIKLASEKIGDWRLDDCVLYTTVKPCLMCLGAIKESRISEVVYCVESNLDKKYYKKVLIKKSESICEKSLYLLKTFFEKRRKK